MVLRVTGKRKGANGGNTHYRLGHEKGKGDIVTREEAVRMCKRGLLPDYHIYERNGVEYLRDNPDTSEDDNIDNQPDI